MFLLDSSAFLVETHFIPKHNTNDVADIPWELSSAETSGDSVGHHTVPATSKGLSPHRAVDLSPLKMTLSRCPVGNPTDPLWFPSLLVYDVRGWIWKSTKGECPPILQRFLLSYWQSGMTDDLSKHGCETVLMRYTDGRETARHLIVIKRSHLKTVMFKPNLWHFKRPLMCYLSRRG